MLCFVLYLTFFNEKKLLNWFLSLIFCIYVGFTFNLFYNFKKCPECYGDELCPFFHNRHIQFSWFSCFLLIFNHGLTKSVFYGMFNETLVVIKRTNEVSEKVDYDELKLNIGKVQDVILCPNVDVKFLLSEVRIEEKRLWLDVKASIEPLLLSFFQSHDKWPFPKYLGACGDLIVEEYKGEPLANFLSSDFEKRCYLALHLLQIAYLFTFKHPVLAFYFTDYSLQNLVVDSRGNISLIDLDNIIISNKSVPNGHDSLNKTTHISEVLDDYNYAFSPYDICSHYLSDHNYFSICKYLLIHPEEGLLKDIPETLKKRKELVELLSECTQPKRDSEVKDRFSAGQKLQFLLEEIISGYEWT